MVSAHQKKFLAKVVLLGDMNVGKTTLIEQFAKGPGGVGPPKTTVGTDFKSKQMSIDGNEVNLQIWDTAGQEKHTSIGFAFYRGTNCCVLTYDVGNNESFERLAFWKKNFLDQAAPQNPDQFPFVVCGNKTDKDRVVPRDVAEKWCADNGGLSYFETVATTGDGVEALFTETARRGKDSLKQSNDDMPMSLSGAAGAIKIDAKSDAVAEEEQKKKKKKCKC